MTYDNEEKENKNARVEFPSFKVSMELLLFDSSLRTAHPKINAVSNISLS